MFFVDSSALVRAYFVDEPGHEELRALLFESGTDVVASEFILLEATRAFVTAFRTRRVRSKVFEELTGRLESDLRGDGVVVLIPLDPALVLQRARELVLAHPIGSADAIHLAVADQDGRRLAGDQELVFVTRDEEQRRAAEALGFATA